MEGWTAKLEAIRGALTEGGRTLAHGSLAWIWARSASTVPIPGFRTASQVGENAGAMRFGALSEEAMAAVDAAGGAPRRTQPSRAAVRRA